MIGLMQRVSDARVEVGGEIIASIGRGSLVLIGIERGDGESEADRLLDRMLGYRIFSDAAGKMNLSVSDAGGGLLLVPQFTLAADTRKGTRASFSAAAGPEAKDLFEYLVQRAQATYSPVANGRFGAAMQVTLTNDGPVTFWLQVAPVRS